MTDNNYKLTLIFYKSKRAPYINVTAISLDKKHKTEAGREVAHTLQLTFGTKSNTSFVETPQCL